jgi:hypothetical protein
MDEAVDERAVDLQVIDRDAAQRSECRMLDAEVIDGQAHAQLLQPMKRLDRGRFVVHHDRFRDFEAQQARIESGVDGDRAHVVDKCPIEELSRRQVYA